MAVSDTDEESEANADSISDTEVNQMGENLAELQLQSNRRESSDSEDELFEDDVREFNRREDFDAQSVDVPPTALLPTILPTLSAIRTIARDLPNLIVPEEPRQRDNAPRSARDVRFGTRSHRTPSQEAVPHIRKRDRLRANFRRIAFSEPFEDDAATTHARHGRRVLSRLHKIMSQPKPKPATPPTIEDEQGPVFSVPRTRLVSLKTITHLAEGSKELSCAICWTESRDTVLVPCGHITSCFKCGVECTQCPVCRELVTDRMKVLQDPVANNKGERGCAVCGKLRDGLFRPCGHICICSGCSEGVEQCPVCQEKVNKTVRLFWS